MPTPFTRNQHLANRAFLAALRRSGNIRLAARDSGIAYGTIQYRRANHPVFAQAMVAALTFAHAALARKGGARRPETGVGPAIGPAPGDAPVPDEPAAPAGASRR